MNAGSTEVYCSVKTLIYVKVDPSVKCPSDSRSFRPGRNRVESGDQDEELLHVGNGEVKGCPVPSGRDLQDEDLDDEHSLERSRHQGPHRGC